MNEAKQDVDLAVVIVSWNTKDLLRQCLAAVFSALESLSSRVLVVDNASQDGSAELVTGSFPQAQLIRNRENLGFARANNQAFKLAGRPLFVLLLNSDAILTKETIRGMLDFMKTHDDAGLVSPALRYPAGGSQPGGGFDASLRTALNYFFFLSVVFPRSFRGMFVDQRRLKRQGEPVSLDWVAGTCMLVRKEVIDRAGGLDESFFMYAEDAEWCERIRKKGWGIYFLPYLEIVHHHGASTPENSDRWLRALMAYMTAKMGVPAAALFRLIAAGGFGMRSGFYFLGSLLTRRSEMSEKARQMGVLAWVSLTSKRN
jgi:GT2 family glycosyltransferase